MTVYSVPFLSNRIVKLGIIVGLLSSLLSTACQESGETDTRTQDSLVDSREHPFGVQVGIGEVTPGMANTNMAHVGEMREATLCEHVWYADGGAARVRVADITSVYEIPDSTPEQGEAWTYVTFEILETFSEQVGEEVVLRMVGGPLPNGNTRGYSFRFVQGEELILLLKGGEAEMNAGFVGTAEDWIWRETSPGVWFNRVSELTEETLVQGLTEAYAALGPIDHPFVHECPVRIPWDRCPASSMIPDSAPRDFDAPESCPEVEEVPLDPNVAGPDEERQPE